MKIESLSTKVTDDRLYFFLYVVIIIVLLAMTPRSEMHSASYVFGREAAVNQSGGWPSGIAFLLGLLSVQWTVRAFLDIRNITDIDLY